MKHTKWIIMVLTACMLLSLGGFAQAASEKALFDITSLGIIQGDENGDYNLDQPLTRAEFAEALLKFLKFDEAAQMAEIRPLFNDVDMDAWYARTISFTVQMNLMNGYGDGTFGPDNTISLEEAVKTIVVSLGYGAVANGNGGYPTGHMIVAAETGLLKNISSGNIFTRSDFVELLYNALDVDLMIQSASGEEVVYEVAKGETIRGRHLLETADEATYKAKGIVSANVDTWLDVPVQNMKDDEVMIDGVIYRVGETNAAALLGQEVDFYTVRGADDRYTLISVQPTRNNYVVTLREDDIKSSSLSQVRYYGEDGREERISIDAQPKIVKNGVLIKLYTEDALLFERGTITLIDNTGDDAADVIFIDEYQNVQVEEVRENLIYLMPGSELDGSRLINVDKENLDVKYHLKDKDGKTLEVQDIQTDDIISVTVDQYKTLYQLVVSHDRVEGTIDEITDDGLVIGGTFYDAEEAVRTTVKVGDSVTAYLDWRGSVANTKELSSAMLYGYIAQIGQQGGFGNTQVKMITGKLIEEDIEMNEQDKDDKNEIPVLVCQNEKVEILDVSDKVSFNGVSVGSTGLLSKIDPNQGLAVKYTLGTDGKIRTIESAQLQGGEVGQKIKYNVKDKVFGGITNIQSFAIDENTKVICLPETVNTDEDYMVQVRIDNTDSTRRFNAQGYEYDTVTKKVKLLVVTEAMDANQVSNVDINSAKLGMVKDLRQFSDESMETKYKLTIVEEDGEVTYETVNIVDKNRIITTLQKGDLIYFVKNGQDKIENVKKIYSFAQGVGTFYRYQGTDDQQICGYLQSLDFDEIDVRENILVTKATIDLDGSSEAVGVAQRNAPPIFIYEESTKEIRTATLREAIPIGSDGGNADRLFIIMPDDDVKACVIVR